MHRLMGLYHNQKKWFAKFCSETIGNWSLDAQTYFLSLALNIAIFLLFHNVIKNQKNKKNSTIILHLTDGDSTAVLSPWCSL
jgi:hypothetical protein